MADNDKYYNEIVEEPIPIVVDRNSKHMTEDLSFSDHDEVNLPSTAEVVDMIECTSGTKRGRQSDHSDDAETDEDHTQRQVKRTRAPNMERDDNNNRGKMQSSNPIQYALPVNHTLNSSGEDRIVIIKIEDSTIFTHPRKFSDLFEKTSFGKANVKDIQTNKLKGLIIVELLQSGEIEKHNLLSVTQIGDWKVICYKPNSDSIRSGVIAPIDITEDISDWKYLIKTEGNIQVLKVERLLKNTREGRVPSTAVKLTFDCKELPRGIKINHFHYPLRPYTRNPIQCFRCQRLGHTAGGCKATSPRCLVCAQNHLVRECTPDNPNIKCANCQGPHKANSRECLLIKKAYEVEKRRANGESYAQARRNVEQENQINDGKNGANGYNTITTVAEVHHGLYSQNNNKGHVLYSDVAKKSIRNYTSQYTNFALNTGCPSEDGIQTGSDRRMVAATESLRPLSNIIGEYNKTNSEEYTLNLNNGNYQYRPSIQMRESSTQTEPRIEENNKEIITLSKFRDCLAEVLSSNIWNECNNNRKKIIDCAIRNVFGIDLTEKVEASDVNQAEHDITIEEGVISSESEADGRKESPFKHIGKLTRTETGYGSNRQSNKCKQGKDLQTITERKELGSETVKVSRLPISRNKDTLKKKEQNNKKRKT
jgi:hypothetical protein